MKAYVTALVLIEFQDCADAADAHTLLERVPNTYLHRGGLRWDRIVDVLASHDLRVDIVPDDMTRDAYEERRIREPRH